ncbi:GMC oxidoreductase [Pseudemcibacter aquimaris]|uniref:GMC oxidoreductase n=1 Tax=Pseudemcibacter aquimaris TaxID=2857064 RepID=UPI00201276D6|nr:GMC family oxidoreductase [Pseudemcibacter aquimaris]MCC3862566.1 GMC family oxidoreductase [Pseudemcibacter aquimaris]WDU57916.1 GMC family oxidoreductase [Pseudemcibacter aquimaris]
MDEEFDAIVVGSGISGGWAAKEFCEKGLKTLVIERGRHVERGDYPTEGKGPWEMPNHGRTSREELAKDYQVHRQTGINEWNKHFFVKDSEKPYSQENGKPFSWIRGHQLGGKSLTWGRVALRLSDLDFEANKKDGFGTDWPIRYNDLASWYDYVETFAGISGSKENIPHLPDGVFQPPMEMNCIENYVKEKVEATYPDRKIIPSRTANLTEPTEEQMELGRAKCQNRAECIRGCSFGAYFSSQSATLPAAERTGNLNIITDAIAHSIEYDAETGKATGVRIIDAKTNEHRVYTAKVIFLCASALGSTQIMLNSISERFPNGIANDSGVLGHYLMDHIFFAGARGRYAGFQDKYYKGRRPNAIYVPRFRNVGNDSSDFLRGYGYEGWSSRVWDNGAETGGYGPEFKESLKGPGEWEFEIMGFGEMLPRFENHVRLHENKTDKWGIPQLHMVCEHSDNEHAMLQDIMDSAVDMLNTAGLKNVTGYVKPKAPGLCIHEMGTARMGRDPNDSILNGFNQAHSVKNLFVTDGAAMTSSGCQNPSLTYMAMTARAVDFAVKELKAGRI